MSDEQQRQALIEENERLRNELSVMRQAMAEMQRQLFGSKSEKLDPGQLSLFEEPGKPASDPPPGPEEEVAPPEPSAEKKKAKRKVRADKLPENLPVKRVEIIPGQVKANPDAWECCGQETSYRMEWEPGYFYKLEIVRKKFRRVDQPYAPPIIEPAVKRVIDNGFWGTELTTKVICDRFCMHMPYYRQSEMFKRFHGVEISRKTMSNVAGKVAEALQPVYEEMKRQMLQGDYLQVDETPIVYLNPRGDGKGSAQGYYWVYRAPNGEVIFDWQTGRHHKWLKEFLADEFEGVLQSDGYPAYTNHVLGQQLKGKDLKRMACLAHIRRYFEKSKDQRPVTVAWMLKLIARLYQIESRLRDANAPPDMRARVRNNQSRPLLRLLEKAVKHLSSKLDILPRSSLGKALGYAREQLPAMYVYLDHGQVEIDNNLAENAIRPTAVGKKNHLFIGSPEAGDYSAVLYSLLISAKACGVSPERYLRDLIERVPKIEDGDYSALTPSAWAMAQSEPQQERLSA